MPKTYPTGSILSNKNRGYIFSFGGKMHGGWKKTPKEAKAVQKAFLEARTKSGAHSFDIYANDLIRAATDAYKLLKKSGIDDPKEIVRAVKNHIKIAPKGDSGMTIGEAFEKVRGWPQFDKLSDKRKHESYLKTFVEELPDGWDTPLKEITLQDFLAVRDGSCRDVSYSKAQKFQTYVSGMFRKYFRDQLGILSTTVFDGSIPAIAGEKEKTERKEIYSPQETRKLLAQSLKIEKSTVWHPLYSICFSIKAFTGMHDTELSELTFGMFGYDGEILFDNPDPYRLFLPPEIMKDREHHSYSMPTILRVLLFSSPWFMKHFEAIDFDDYTEYDQIDRAEVFLGSLGMQLGEGNSGCILPAGFRGIRVKKKFMNKKLLPFATRVISDNIKKWADKARGVQWKTNTYRHTFISYAYQALCGGDIKKLQQAVGHSEGTTVTARHYLNSVPVDHGKDYFDHRNLSKAFMKEWSSRDKNDVNIKPFGESRGTLDQVRRVKNITEDPEDKIFDM